jgi:hypothetical protein
MNTLIDMVLGNQTGRLKLIGDGGLERQLQGGTTISSLNHSMQVQNAATGGQHAAFVLSATAASAAPTFANSVVRILDAGIGIGAGKALTMYHTDGATNGTIVSNASGTLVLSAIEVTGAALVKGNTTLGDNVADTVTITGVATVGSTLGVTGMTTLTGSLTMPGSAYIAMGATPATVGEIRLTNNQFLYSKESGGTDRRMIGIGSDDFLRVGDSVSPAGIANAMVGATSNVYLAVDSDIVVHANTSGIGFNGTAGVAPPTLSGSAAAAYDATTRQLINDIRDCLQDNGLAD